MFSVNGRVTLADSQSVFLEPSTYSSDSVSYEKYIVDKGSLSCRSLMSFVLRPWGLRSHLCDGVDLLGDRG